MFGLKEVTCALILVIVTAALSYRQGHRLHRELTTAAIRIILQLLLLGLILTWVFKHATPLLSLTIGFIMTINSAIHSRARVKSKYPGIFLDHLVATVLSIWPLALIGSNLLHADPWWRLEIFLPLLGLLLGSTLNALSLGVDQFTHEIREKKDEVLSWIALGATTEEATLPLFRRCLKIALSPTLNAMFTMGLVSIPGMMTGQILAGNSPQEAAITQIIFMLLLSMGAYFGTWGGLILARKKLFNTFGQPCF